MLFNALDRDIMLTDITVTVKFDLVWEGGGGALMTHICPRVRHGEGVVNKINLQ